MDDVSQSSASPSGVNFFDLIAKQLGIGPDEYHDGAGGGQSTPNTQFGPLPSGVRPDGSGAPLTAGDPAAPAQAASIAPPAAPPAGAAPMQGAVPLTTGGATPVTPYTGAELDQATKMSGPQTPLPNSNLRMAAAALGGSQVFNQTINDIQSGDEARQRMASNTIQMARNINSLAQEGFKTQELAIQTQNQQSMAQAANDPNSSLTALYKAQALDGVANMAKDVSVGADGKETSTPLMGANLATNITAFLNKPGVTAFQIMQNPILANIPSVAAINQTNIENAVKLQTVANQHITAVAAQSNAAAEGSKAATAARNQNMLENATGISGAPAGSAAATAAPATAPSKSKYVLDRNGVELSPAEKGTQEAASKEVATVRAQQDDLNDTLNKLNAAKAAVSALPFTGPIAEYAGAGTDAVQKAKAALAGVGLAYTKAFAEDAGARAGGNMMIEQKEQQNVGNLGQNKATIINSLQRMEQSIRTKQDYNKQIMDQSKNDPSLESFKYTPLYNGKSWLRHTDKNGNQAYVSPDGTQVQAVQ